MSSRSRIQLEEYLKTIDVSGAVLDIGGSQNPIKGRTKTWNPTRYDISDLEMPHGVKVPPDLVMDINEKMQFGKRRYDMIFCIEVMEYVYDPVEAIYNIYKLLNKGGVAYVTLHLLYGLHPPKEKDCLRYTKYAIQKMTTQFSNVEYTPRTIGTEGRKFLEMFYRAEGMRLDYSDPETWIEGYIVKLTK